MVSLLELAEITEEGVSFKSPHDGSMMLLTPEHSIHIQNSIGWLLYYRFLYDINIVARMYIFQTNFLVFSSPLGCSFIKSSLTD